MNNMLGYLRDYKRESVLAPLFKMLEATFDLFVPLVMADIVNVGIAAHDLHYILVRCGILLVLAVIGLTCSLTAQYFSAKAAVGYSTSLRHALFAHIQSLSFSEMDTLGTSTLITRMTSDINQVQSGLNLFLRLFLRSPFVVIGAMVMAFTVNARAALIFVVAIPLLSVVVFGVMVITRPLYKTAQVRLDRVLGLTRENLTGVRVVRAFDKEQDEIDRFPTEREALIEALSKSIVEISSSSLTTISGLVALMLMQFRLGYDLGLVLSKGILCSLITVFLLMPGLIASFFRPLRRTTHKSHVPDITGWGRFLMKTRFGFVAVFVIILPLAIWCSSRTEYAFNDAGIDELKYSESRAAARKITGTFANDTTIAVLVPSGNYEAEKQFLRDAAELDNVKTVTGLANIEIEDGKVLTDSYTPRMFSMLLNIDFEEAEMLYAAYGVENGQYQPIFGNAETYSVPLIDMFLFVCEQVDAGIVTLSDEQTISCKCVMARMRFCTVV